MNDQFADECVKVIQSGNINEINQYLEHFFESIDIDKLIKKIKRFRYLNIASLKDDELKYEIKNILMHNNIWSLINTYSVFKTGRYFYRVRLLKNFDFPNENLQQLSDFWNPPIKFVDKYGRINAPHESLLYTSFNPQTAIYEKKAFNLPIALFAYKNKRDIKVSWIGAPTNYKHHNFTSPKAICVHEIINNFLIDEFTQEVPVGKESMYRITEHIAKEYFYDPNGSGWRYPSIKKEASDNICFSTNKLTDDIELVGAIIGTMYKNGGFDFKYFIRGTEIEKNYLYTDKDNVEFFKRLFPEFKKI